MGRIVRSGRPAAIAGGLGNLEAAAAGGAAIGEMRAEQGDTYLERVAKYVPAEIVAFFIFVNSILSDAADKAAAATPDNSLVQAMAAGSPAAVRKAIDGVAMAGISIWTISWIVIVVAMLMTPLYLMSVRDSTDSSEHPYINIAMALIAFPFWAYAVDALAFKPWHDGALASVMLATFTVVSGAIRPDLLSGLGRQPAGR